jgi:polysaccharide deacetylase family protein (PEP-CTERM system associated)
MLNALTIDLEEWYHPEAIRTSGKRIDRVPQANEATTPILDLLKEYAVKATFFTVGELAAEHPKLIERILNEGHELAFHGWSHDPLWIMSRETFSMEVSRFLAWRDATFPGVSVQGFRAPTFSLDQQTVWAIPVLREYGFTYDSSVFPARTPLYGVHDAPRHAYCINPDDPAAEASEGLLEVPMSVYNLGVTRIGFTGGLYLRALPWTVVRQMVNSTNKKGRPAVFYVHPWETFAGTPRVKLSRWGRFVLYYGLPSSGKLEKLLKTFAFDTMQNIFLASAL